MLNELAEEIREISRAKGWKLIEPTDWEDDDDRITINLLLIHSEVSKALEALRVNEIKSFSEKMADILLRVLNLSSGLDIDIESAVQQRMAQYRI